MKIRRLVYPIVLPIGLILSTNSVADTRCEVDQLNAVASYCRSLLNCTANHLAKPSQINNCENTAKSTFNKRYVKSLISALGRGGGCDYQADFVTAGELFFNTSSALSQNALFGWEALPAKNRWYKSLLNTMATSCADLLQIEARYARDNNADKRLQQLSKHLLNRRNRLDYLIAHTRFAYTGSSSSELLDSLTGFTDNAVAIIRPELGGQFSVSALASLADSIFIDSDTNNIAAGRSPNDTFLQAQSVPVPSMVGGYVSFGTDIGDIYQVSLSANQVINLSIGNASADLDLFLYRQDDTSNPVDQSIGITPFETVTATSAGNYYVKVHAYTGDANYALSFGQQSAGQAAGHHPEFVPGEIIVRKKNPATNVAASATLQAKQMANSLGFNHLGGGEDREMLWQLSDDASQRQASLQRLGVQSTSHNAASKAGSNLAADTLAAVKVLRKRADVASADLNYIRHPSAIPTDPYYARQWHYPLISLPTAWDTSTGQNSIVAVIDTGVLMNHPDLQGQFVTGFDFISNPNVANDGDGIDTNPNDPGDNPGGGSSYHGTHVSGTVAAVSNNQIGVAGVAWNAKIMPLRVLGVGGGTDYDINQAMRYAARLSNDSGRLPERKADVINFSLGGEGSSMSTQLAINDVRAAGVIIVAAAGNSASNTPFYPAAYQGVVSVSAVDTQKHLAPYSNFGSSVDVAAPGGDTSVDRNGDGFADGVLSTLASGDAASNSLAYTYQLYQGTSMATPHVAGVVALMKAVDPALSPDSFDKLLQDGKLTQDIGAAGKDDQFGYGLINAQMAVNAKGGGQPAPPSLASAPTGLNFGANTSSLSLNLFNAGSGELNVSLLQSDQAWLTITATNTVDAHQLGTYTVSVNRTGLTEGVYSASITISSNGGNLSIPVLMRVGGTTTSDTGLSYFLLTNTTTGNQFQLEVVSREGAYQLDFSGVPKGDYWLLGGTDMNNDGILCADGELCGGYPSIERLTPITVDSDIADLKFTANFAQSLQSPAQLSGKLATLFKNPTNGLPIDNNSGSTGVKRSPVIK